MMKTLKTPLFHYTTRDGFLNILRSRKIWSSSIFYLNDSEEYLYTVNLIINIINEYLKTDKRLTGAELFLLSEVKKEFLNPSIGSLRSGPFIFSLSSERDLLSQWRGYSDLHCGISLGFDPEYIIALANKQQSYLYKCIYDVEQQNTEVRRILEENLLMVRGFKSSFIMYSQVPFCVKSLRDLCPLFKDPSFRQECEWRIVSSAVSEIKFRNSSSMIIPYMEIELDGPNLKPGLDEVIVGPTCRGSW